LEFGYKIIESIFERVETAKQITRLADTTITPKYQNLLKDYFQEKCDAAALYEHIIRSDSEKALLLIAGYEDKESLLSHLPKELIQRFVTKNLI
jgi:hypothetical protein